MKLNKSTVSGILAATLTFYSCGGGETADAPGDIRLDNTRCVDVTQQTSVTTLPVDLLFVIDNSLSMCAEQVALSAGMQNLAQSLATIGLNDLHMGIVTTDFDNTNQQGQLQSLENGSFFTTDASQASIDEIKKMFEYTGAPGDKFIGCAEGPLEEGGRAAVEAVTTHALGTNAGFMRDDANLVVIVLTDENDDSPATPAEIAQALVGAKGNDPYKVFYNVIGHSSPDNGQVDACYNSGADEAATKYFDTQLALQALRPNDVPADLSGNKIDICLPNDYPAALEEVLQEGTSFTATTIVDLKPFNFIPALSTLQVTANGQAVSSNDYSYNHDDNTITLLGASLLQPDVSIRVCGVPEDLGEI